MKVSLNWTEQVSNVDLRKIGDDKLLEKIGAQLGAIDEVEYWGPRFDGILVVKVLECKKHGNADKLNVCVIDDGGKTQNVERDSNGHIQIVCGAPNARADIFAAWIPPGVTVPSTLGKEPLIIEAREIRGQKSNGMLASLHELGISDDHSGILEIKPDEVGEELAKPGTEFKQLYKLDDVVPDIENKMFTHRPDLFGVLGNARELAGIQQLAFKSPDWYLKEPEFESSNDSPLEISVEDQTLVPRFMAVVIKDVKVGLSPTWMQAGLTRVGIRSINNVVDITNFVMHLTGQPLHAYDLDKLLAVSGQTKAKLETRNSKKGDRLNLLNGKALELQDDSTVLITSNDIPVGIGGVMGGADTEVDDSTKNIVLECATFDMYNIRRTSMKYGLFTDAVTRFNKGQSQLQNDRIMSFAKGMIVKHAGGQQASDVKDVHGDLPALANVKTSTEFINVRLGSQLSTDEMANLLRNVEFNVEANGDELNITAPFWRTDIEITEDIVEEVGRLYGYDRLPIELPKRSIQPAARNQQLEFKTRIRNVLSAAGANEILTYTFVHGDLFDKVGQNKDQAFELSNAISPDLQHYRLSLTPSLLEKVHPNIKQGYSEFALFEINPVHAKDFKQEDGLPAEAQRLSLVFAADDKTAKQNYAGAAYYQAKTYLSGLLTALGIDNVGLGSAADYETKATIEQAALAPFEKKHSAVIKTKEGQLLGFVGEYRSSVRKSLKLPAYSAGFELNLDQLINLAGKTGYQPIPRFPQVSQDITLKVSSETTYQDVYILLEQSIAKDSEGANFSISLKDIYQDQADKQHKNLTLHLEIASYDRTLTAQEVNSLLDKAAGNAKTKLGAERV